MITLLIIAPLHSQSKETGSIEIISSPDKAMVHIDGVKQGLTPFTVKDLAVGEHSLKIHKEGFQDHEQQISIVSGSNPSVGVALNILTHVRLTSKPKGAAIYLDGSLIGTTPFKEKLPTGRHSLELKLLGYEDIQQDIVIIEDYSKKFKLSKLYEIAFSSEPVGAEIFLDGKYIADAPYSGSFAAGKHAVKIHLDGYEDLEKQINLKKT